MNIYISKNEIKDKIQSNGFHNTVHYIKKLIYKNKIQFPYKKYYIKSSKELFYNLKKYDISIIYDKPYTLKNIITNSDDYYNLFYIPYNGHFVIIPNNPDNYNNINVIADHFTEDARVKSIGYMQEMSPYECWNNDECIEKIIIYTIKKFGYINIETLRESLYKNITEARQGTPTSYFILYHFFKAKHILDGASAWGDRLISALACKKVKTYVGVDPNNDLFGGYYKIIKKYMKIKHVYIEDDESNKIIEKMIEEKLKIVLYKKVIDHIIQKLETYSINKKKKII